MPRLIVEILADTSSVERGFMRASRSASGFNRNLNQAGRGAIAGSLAFKGLGRSVAFASSAFLGSAGMIALLTSSVDAASNLAEQTSKTNEVFDASAAAVKAWSKTTVESMGLASDKSLDAVSTFGLLFRNIGQGAAPAAQLSEELVQLGADLASFSNTSLDDALRAIRSGLTGEIEPLRRYGVFLSEARTRTQALADTNKKNAVQLTTGEKVLARYKLLLQDTTRAQGDFARTSGGLANQQRILQANLRELQIMLGTALIPKVLEVVTGMNDWLAVSENQENMQRKITRAVEIFSDTAGTGVRAFDTLAEAAGRFASALDRVDAAFGGGKPSSELPPELQARFEKRRKFLEAQAKAEAKTQGEFIRSVEAFNKRFDEAGTDTSFIDTRKLTPLSRPASAAEQFRIALAASPDDPNLLKQQRAKAQGALDFALKQLREHRGDTAKFADHAKRLSSDIAGINSRLTGFAEDDARSAKDAADKIKAARKKNMEALRAMFKEPTAQVTLSRTSINAAVRGALATLRQRKAAARQAQQFRALGLSGAGDELAPGRKALRTQASQLGEALKGTFLDTGKTRSVMAGIRRALKLGVDGMSQDVRRTVKDMLDDLDRQLGDQAKTGNETKFRTTNVRRILAGAGLSPEDVKAASAALSRRGAGGTVPGRGRGAFGVALGTRTPEIVNHTHVYLDGKPMETVITRRQQVRKSRNPVQKRGPHAP